MGIKHDPYAALRYRDFRYYTIGQFCLTVAILIQEVLIGYYIYKLTKDPLALGFVGLAEALPYISLALFGGYFADNKDKKSILSICLLGFIIATLCLIYVTNPSAGFSTKTQIPILYFVIFLVGVVRGFYSPSWASIRPFLVDTQHYSNAASWASQAWQSGAILGPGVAGFLYAYLGFTQTMYLVLALFCFVFFLIRLIKPTPIQTTEQSGGIFNSLKEGIQFVFSKKILYFSITLDLFSVLFGGVVALLPIFAEDILKVGAEGLGILRAAPAVGAVLTMFLTTYFPPTKHAWRNMLLAVLGFGLATLLFALSKNMVLSCFALFLIGAFDSISVIIRQTILQVLPPDNMRGRVNSVSGIFVSCSNELGAFESGLAASLIGTVPSVLFGGVMTLLVVAYIYSRSKELFGVKLV